MYSNLQTSFCSQVDVLERDVLELLSLVRSVKNTLSPINRIPRDVLSIIPEYWADEDKADDNLITLTHVCRDWREVFVSRPSLWTRLDCTNVKKTRTYVERSKLSPLKVHLWWKEECISFLDDAFLLTVPHLGRFRSLSLFGPSDNLVGLINELLYRPAPFLEKLKISFGDPHSVDNEFAIFGGNLSSLRELRFVGVITSLPWKNLANLTTFEFHNVPSNTISVTRLLDFFEHAPLLRHIRLWDILPTVSNTPPGRVVSLPHLEDLDIKAQPAHSILLKHLLIPNGTSLVLEFNLDSERTPIPDYLPKRLDNLSHITEINLSCNLGLCLRLNGPSGGLYVLGHRTGAITSLTVANRKFLRSLNHFDISGAERFAITAYDTAMSQKFTESPAYQTLHLMKTLRTLILAGCLNTPFITVLNPDQTPTRTLVCPALEELVLYVKKKEWLHIKGLLGMAKGRSSSRARLSTIEIVSPHEVVSAKDVLELRNYVSRVEYRLGDTMPQWDEIGHENDRGWKGSWGYESDW